MENSSESPADDEIDVDALDFEKERNLADKTLKTGASKKGCSAKWTDTIIKIQKPIVSGMHVITQISAKNPKRTVAAVIFVSIALIVIGLFTNFDVDVDEDVLWTPKNSRPILNSNWIDNKAGYPESKRPFSLFFHADGNNVLSLANVQDVFEVFEGVQALDNYNEVCMDSDYLDSSGAHICEVSGIVRFWNYSKAIFLEQVTSDEELIAALSSKYYPDGTPVSESEIFGFPLRDNGTGELTFVQSFGVVIYFPDTSKAETFETDAIDVAREFDQKWEDSSSGPNLRVEVDSARSFADEFTRAIVTDIPLLPIVFIIMSLFTCLVFYKRNSVYSRSLLGFTAVVSVLLSIMSGYGLLFICGIPFTSMTQILPFVVFGVGLDDAFIIAGSYTRTDHTKDPEDRVKDVIDDIGISIFLTTFTTVLAFGLSCTSRIPAVYWLSLYALPTFAIVLFYQLTFFVGCIVLDERRIQNRRRDCCLCWTVANDEEQEGHTNDSGAPEAPLFEKFMVWYANHLLKTWVKVLVVLSFAGLAVGCAFSASKLTQEFKFTSVLPTGSYVADFYEATNAYTTRNAIQPGAYFRFVDQSDEDVQRQMEAFVNDLVALNYFGGQPDYFWLRDFKAFVNQTKGVTEMSFNEQIAAFLNEPVFRDLYSANIVLDELGSIVTSRVWLYMDNVDAEVVKQQIDALEDLDKVTEQQDINRGQNEWLFFTYDGIYNIWAFYQRSVRELIGNTIYGVVAVTLIALVLIPHWTAALFVLPLISILYVDMLGAIQWGGVHINAVSYIALVMSIGLLVDFLLHILIRFYETPGTRKEKTVELLRTMGASVLVGGVSTFLGTLPLAFSTSEIFNTIFVSFLALVTLGVSHGLILLPVILSTIGPEDHVARNSNEPPKKTNYEEPEGQNYNEQEEENHSSYSA